MAIPVRRCLVCRRRTARDHLVRFVVADGMIVVDPLARRPGRGAHVCSRGTCVDAALRRGGAPLLSALRADRRQVTVDEDAIRAAVAEHRGQTSASSGPEDGRRQVSASSSPEDGRRQVGVDA